MTEIQSACEIADDVRGGKASASKTVSAALARVDEQNERLNAFVAIDREGALRAAAEIDARIATGEDPGILSGVPIGVKDLEAVAGLPHTNGSQLFRDHVADEDSVQVARLRAAGAVVLGKTNTPEFGHKVVTNNRVFGPSRNPWDTELSPGGSSGGSAAAVAAGMVPVCTGSDGGGSIRIPAALTGCFGIKPTCGRVPNADSQASHWTFLSHRGPLTRTVRDAARYLDVVSGPHPDDLDSLDAPAGGFERELDDLPPVRRIGLSLDLGYASVEDEVKDLVATAARSIADEAGAELTSVPPLFQDPFPTWAVIASAGDAALHATWTDEQREMAERGYIAFGAQGYALTAVQYADALQERHQLNRRINGFFADFDLLLTPAAPTTAWPAKGPTPQSIGGKAASPAAAVAFTYPFNITGHPAASVPAGLAANGLPVGLQVVGPRFRDSLVLQAAAAFEKAVGWDFPD